VIAMVPNPAAEPSVPAIIETRDIIAAI